MVDLLSKLLMNFRIVKEIIVIAPCRFGSVWSTRLLDWIWFFVCVWLRDDDDIIHQCSSCSDGRQEEEADCHHRDRALTKWSSSRPTSRLFSMSDARRQRHPAKREREREIRKRKFLNGHATRRQARRQSRRQAGFCFLESFPSSGRTEAVPTRYSTPGAQVRYPVSSCVMDGKSIAFL